MGWVKNNNGGVEYYHVLNGANSNHTHPRSNGSEAIPVCVVVCTQKPYKAYSPAGVETSLGGWARVFHANTDWKVLNARVQLVRYYAASSARVSLGIALPTKESRIPAPGLVWDTNSPELNANRYTLEGLETEKYTQELRPEMDIEIWLGYIGRFENISKYVIKEGTFSYTCDGTKFTKVFTGVIDTVDLKLGRGENQADGVNCVISARDKMRYLIDNKMFGGISLANGESFYTPQGISRSRIIQTLISQGSAGGCKAASDPLFHPTGRPPMVFYNQDAASTAVSGNTSAFLMAGSVPFQLMDQFPVDAIRWFSTIETMPRELFCDPNTGDIAWTCRTRGEPYKTTAAASLFSESDLPVIPNNSFDDLWKSISEANWESTHSTNPDRTFTPELSRTLATEVVEIFQTTLAKHKYLDPITFCAMIDFESGGWDPGNVNPSSGATGLGQIYSIPPGFTKEDLLDPVKNLRAAAFILNDKASLRTSKSRKTLGQLVQENKISPDDAQLICYTLYNGNAPKVLKIVDEILDTGKLVTYSEVSAKIGTGTSGDPNNNIYGQRVRETRMNKARWRKFYEGIVLGKLPTHVVKNSSTASQIGVLHGVDDPWILSYKRTVTKGNQQIKPNILSAHSSWSTLGVITRFSLINPVVKEGNAGGGGIRGSHSLWAFNPPSGSTGLTMPQAYGTTNHPTDKFLPKSESVESLKNRIKMFSELEKTQEETTKNSKTSLSDTDPNLLYLQGPTDMTLPYKYLTKIRFPVRNRFLWDETADSSIGDAAVDLILDSMMHIHGQDIHAVDFMVPMNPDIRPSHMVEMYNMGFFDAEQLRVEGVVHMFASGGVQNGCTTMGVAVSPQGAYDPREIPEIINSILRIQNAAMDFASDNSYNSTDTLKVSIYTDQINFEKISFLMPQLKALQEAVNFLSSTLPNVIQPLNTFLSSHPGSSGFLGLVSNDPDGQIIIRELEYIKTQLKVLVDEKLIHDYRIYAFQHLAWGLGALEIKEEQPAGRFGKIYGIDIKKAKELVAKTTKRISSLGRMLEGTRNKILKFLKAKDPSWSFVTSQDNNDAVYKMLNELKLRVELLKRVENTPFADFFQEESNSKFIEFLNENKHIILARHSYKYLSPRGMRYYQGTERIDSLQLNNLRTGYGNVSIKTIDAANNWFESRTSLVDFAGDGKFLESRYETFLYDNDQKFIQKYSVLILMKAILLSLKNIGMNTPGQYLLDAIKRVDELLKAEEPAIQLKLTELENKFSADASTAVSALPPTRSPLPFS